MFERKCQKSLVQRRSPVFLCVLKGLQQSLEQYFVSSIQPKTFGKKDGTPPVTGAHPDVQDFVASQMGGSLPNSGTASPVHLPQMSGSVPASPDHFR